MGPELSGPPGRACAPFEIGCAFSDSMGSFYDLGHVLLLQPGL
jgi:hypothetical protein